MLLRNVPHIDAYTTLEHLNVFCTTLELYNDFCGKRKFQRHEYPLSKTRLPDKEIVIMHRVGKL